MQPSVRENELHVVVMSSQRTTRTLVFSGMCAPLCSWLVHAVRNTYTLQVFVRNRLPPLTHCLTPLLLRAVHRGLYDSRREGVAEHWNFTHRQRFEVTVTSGHVLYTYPTPVSTYADLERS